jgi:PAT family beta-lactamase induction signal transducer AmpG
VSDRETTRATRLGWIGLLSFASGFPFGLVNPDGAFLIVLRSYGMSLSGVGLLSAGLGLPYTFKFLWAPLVDAVGARRIWVRACLFAIAVGLLVAGALDPSIATTLLALALLAVAVFSATQDIAINAFTIELVPREELGVANGVAVPAYRAGMIVAKTGFLIITKWLDVLWALAASSALVASIASLVRVAPEPARAPREPGRSPFAVYVRDPLGQFLARAGFVPVALFILSFKAGDYALAPMANAFWVDRRMPLDQIGYALSVVGIGATIVGALVGGALTTRLGTFRALWILGIPHALVNLAYTAAALAPASLPLMYVVAAIESFGVGLGTAPYLAFLMASCDRSRAATQYALLTALYGLSRSALAAQSGLLAERLGYPAYFFATFLIAMPAYALLPWVKRWLDEPYLTSTSAQTAK